MRKIFLTISLSIVLTTSGFAGEIPLAGVAGCAPGLWYPESQVCVPPGLSAPVPAGKDESTILDSFLTQAILYFRPMFD